MNIELKNGKVLVLKTQEKVSTIIEAPQVADKKPQWGVVVAVGEGAVLPKGGHEAVDVKVGDTVYFVPYAPSEIKIDGKVYLVIDHKDLLGVEEASDG